MTKEPKQADDELARDASENHRSGCEICRNELGSFYHPHLVNVFSTDVPAGDLSGLGRIVIEAPSRVDEPDGRVTYQNDFIYRCSACHALWLQQYWEVDTPERQYQELGHRHSRVFPLSEEQVLFVRAALKSGRKLSHDQFK